MNDPNCICEIFYGAGGDVEVEICDYCAAEEPGPEPTPWATEVQAIRRILDRWAVAENNGQKADLLRTLLTICLGYGAFLATHPPFRNALTEKVAEARTDPVFGPLVPELLEHVDAMLSRLPERADFVE
jgi:hypothetical protein